MVIQRPRPSGLKFRPFGLEISAPWLPRPPKAAPRRLGLNDREQALVERIKRLEEGGGLAFPQCLDARQADPRAPDEGGCLLPVQPLCHQPLLDALPPRGHPAEEAPRAAGVVSLAEPRDRGQAGPGARPGARLDLRRQRGRRDHPGDPPPVHQRRRSWSTCPRSRPTTSSPGRTPRSSSTSCARKTSSASTPARTSSWSVASGPTPSC